MTLQHIRYIKQENPRLRSLARRRENSMQRCFQNIVAGISLLSLLVGAFLLTAPLRADDLTEAIDRVLSLIHI